MCQEPVGFASLFPWKAFSFSLILCSVILLQFIYTCAKLSRLHPKYISSHSCVLRMLREWSLWCFGSNLDHWHFVDSKSTRWMLTKKSSWDCTHSCSASIRLLTVLDLRPFSFGSGRGCKWSRLTSIPLHENCVMTKKLLCHDWNPLSMFFAEDKNPSQVNFFSQIKLTSTYYFTELHLK